MIDASDIEQSVSRIYSDASFPVRRINIFTIRIEISAKDFIDIFQSVRSDEKYAFHAQLSDGRVFRLDNRPERGYQKLPTFPWHFHKGSEDHVLASPFPKEIKPALLAFLRLIKKEMEDIR